MEIHHIFPKNLLYKNDYSKAVVNALANYTFLTKETNLAISNKPPKEYIPEYMKKTPGAIESHWIPTDSRLHEVENYEESLAKRRELLAEAANKFLDSLINNTVNTVAISNFSSRDATDHIDIKDEEEEKILGLLEWLEERNLPLGEINYEITDENGSILTRMDVAWPTGIQQELSEPVALMMDEEEDDYNIANEQSFRYFKDIASLKKYVNELFRFTE